MLASMDTDRIHDHRDQHDPVGYALIGACFEVYKQMGHGFLEEVYQESLQFELSNRGIRWVARPKLQLFYKETPLQKQYEPDLIVADEVVLELKAVKTLLPEHEAQLPEGDS